LKKVWAGERITASRGKQGIHKLRNIKSLREQIWASRRGKRKASKGCVGQRTQRKTALVREDYREVLGKRSNHLENATHTMAIKGLTDAARKERTRRGGDKIFDKNQRECGKALKRKRKKKDGNRRRYRI